MNQLNRKMIIVVLISAAFVALLNQTLLIVALPPIMLDFGIDANKAQWVTTAFLLTNGILIPISAFLIEKHTNRMLLISAMSIFTIGTIVGAVAPTFSVLLVARIIQAIGAGMIMPLMQTVLLTMFPPEKRGSAMGMAGLVIGFAPAIGPTLSGWVLDQFSWRYLFYIIIPIAILNIVVAIFLMKNVTERREVKIDLLSIIFSSLGFGGLLYGFSSTGAEGWGSRTVISSLLIGAIALTLFIFRQYRLTRPILNFRVFQSKIFRLTVPLGMFVFAILIGTETLLPLYIQNVKEASAFESGLILLPGALAMGIMSPITGKIFDKYGGRLLALTGFSLLMLTTMPFVFLTMDTSTVWIAIVFAIRMIGLSMVMMPLTTAGINSLPPHLIAHGTAMDNTMRQVGGSIGTALLISVMSSVALNANTLSPATDMLSGIQMSFVVTGLMSLIGFVLAFKLKPKSVERQKEAS